MDSQKTRKNSQSAMQTTPTTPAKNSSKSG